MTSIRTALLAVAALAAATVTAAPVLAPVASSEPYVTPYAPEAETRRPAPVVAEYADVPVAQDVVFRTPEAAMRYLAWAYNGHHEVELRHVTTPIGRDMLTDMRGYMPTLRLVSCAALPSGAYDCAFKHSLAKHPGKEGDATLHVAPAKAHGWYMTVLLDCGDEEEPGHEH